VRRPPPTWHRGQDAEQHDPEHDGGQRQPQSPADAGRVEQRARAEEPDQPGSGPPPGHAADQGGRGQLQHGLGPDGGRADTLGRQQPDLQPPPVGPVAPGRDDQQQGDQGARDRDRGDRGPQCGHHRRRAAGHERQVAGGDAVDVQVGFERPLVAGQGRDGRLALGQGARAQREVPRDLGVVEPELPAEGLEGGPVGQDQRGRDGVGERAGLVDPPGLGAPERRTG
jgi:hypothetical protein